MNTEDLHRNMIAFGEWIFNNCNTTGGDLWFYHGDDDYHTTEELFQIYLKSLNNEI